MPEVICNTSPLQYLHQLRLLHILPTLASRIIVPTAVEAEIAVGHQAGIDLPDLGPLDWLEVRSPSKTRDLPFIHDLGAGEAEVLLLSLESPGSLVILDDLLARRVAETLEIPITGTLGLLLDGKRAGLIPEIQPLLDQLDRLRFRLSAQTRAAVLTLAGETSKPL